LATPAVKSQSTSVNRMLCINGGDESLAPINSYAKSG
jgi:hypothetical protein